jgi:hypothetical protein
VKVRKRVAIGLPVIVAMGVLAFLVSGPKRGTVEYHKRKYVAACDVKWKQRWEAIRSSIMREDQRGVRFDVAGMKQHEGELLRLGYLAQREFAVSNRSIDAVMSHIAGWVVRSPNEQFYRYTTPATNRVMIVAAKEDMPKIEELVRQGDVAK